MKPKASSLKISMKMTNLYQNEGWGRREGGREKEKERELVVLEMKKGEIITVIQKLKNSKGMIQTILLM
jgi:hypothetical protein